MELIVGHDAACGALGCAIDQKCRSAGVNFEVCSLQYIIIRYIKSFYAGSCHKRAEVSLQIGDLAGPHRAKDAFPREIPGTLIALMIYQVIGRLIQTHFSRFAAKIAGAGAFFLWNDNLPAVSSPRSRLPRTRAKRSAEARHLAAAPRLLHNPLWLQHVFSLGF